MLGLCLTILLEILPCRSPPALLIIAGCAAAISASAAQPERVSATAQIVVTSRPPGAEAGPRLYGLTRDDLDLITKALPNLQLAVPVRQVRHEVRFGDRLADVRLTGTTEHYAESHELELSRGRFLTNRDVEQLENVAVLNEQAAGHLFGQGDPLGKSVRIGGHFFLVVGTLKSRDSRKQALGEEARSEVYVPITTMRSRLGDLYVVRMGGGFQAEHIQLSRIELTLRTEEIEKSLVILKDLLQRLHEDASYDLTTSLKLESRIKQ